MSHPPKTSLTSRELADSIVEELTAHQLVSRDTVRDLAGCEPVIAALIDAWVRQERDAAHAAAIAAAVRVCYGDGAGESPDTWDWRQRDYANAISAITPADAQRLQGTK